MATGCPGHTTPKLKPNSGKRSPCSKSPYTPKEPASYHWTSRMFRMNQRTGGRLSRRPAHCALATTCASSSSFYTVCMPRKPYRAVASIDEDALAAFQAGIRKRYTDEQILAELRACAERLGRSPPMREFAADPRTRRHPPTP